MNSFVIQSIDVQNSPYIGDSDSWILSVTVRVNAAEWKRLQKRNQLGYLYNIAIGNYLYRLNSDYGYSCPTVADRGRSKGGWKIIMISSRFSDSQRAQRLGCELVAGKYPKYGNRVQLLAKPITVLREVA